MAAAIQTYDLFLTSVDKFGPLLKIWGQTDRQTSLYIEQVLLEMLKQFDQQTYIKPVINNNIHVGLMCCAKYKDGIYYRAQVRNINPNGRIEVRFIDYGNIELIQLENIRLFDEKTLRLSTIPPQASEFILACVMHANNDWDEQSLTFVHQEVAYTELKTIVVHNVHNLKLVKVLYRDSDLATYLTMKGLTVPLQLETQDMYIRNLTTPHLIAQKYQKVPELLSYKTTTLPPDSEHMVYVSYVEDGPLVFSVQLQSMETTLEKLMADINRLQLEPLTEPPIPGHPCMARCLEDNTVCRAVVVSFISDKCKTYYVDFGNTDVLPLSNIYQIPPSYMLPRAMSMRFTLADLKNMNITNEMKCAFKDFVTNKLLKLKVKLEDSPLIQYCELYENDKNISDILYDKPHQYHVLTLNKGQKSNVIVSYIEGCKKFFVQLKECTESLNSLMLALAATSDNTVPLTELKPGLACCAFYSGDKQWYRAQIVSLNSDNVTVKYVDYGNHETIPSKSIHKIDPQFVDILPAQAIECCLYGYQNMSFNSEIENVFESLTLECEFSMKVKSKQNNVLLVDLFDSSCNNVAALLIEKLAAQKMQMTSLPSQQIATAIMNDTGTENNDDKISWRNNENNNKTWRSNSYDKNDDKSMKKPDDNKPWKNQQDDKKSWRSDDNKSWRSDDKKGSWRSNDDNSRCMSVSNRLAQYRNVAHKKKREKNQWNDDSGGRGDSWEKSKRQDRSRSRGDNWTDKKPFNKQNSWGDDSNRKKFNKTDSWDDKKPNNRTSSFDDKPSRRKDSFDSQSSDRRKFQEKPNRNWGDNNGKSFQAKKDFSSPKRDKPQSVEYPLAELNESFRFQQIQLGTEGNVAISWFYNPQNFIVQCLSQQQTFRDMMVQIQDAYMMDKEPLDTIPVGSSVIAEFSEDSILYRAIVLEQKGTKYKVQYVDFGNIGMVDQNKVYQVEKRFMKLPIQGIRCCLENIKPVGDNWQVSESIDNLFSRDNFTCVFDNYIDDMYMVQLWDGDKDLRMQLINDGFATDPLVFQMDGEPVDVNILIGQTLRVHLSYIESMEIFFVQIDPKKMAQIDNVIDTSTQDETTFHVLSSEYILPETTCLFKSGNKCYRGTIIDNQDLEKVIIISPDIGRQFVVKSTQIYPLPPDLCVYWYQSFECGLNNLTNDSCRLLSDEDFKNKNENNDVIIYVDNIENGRLLVTLYDLNGLKLELFVPDDDAYPTVDKICPLPVFNSMVTIYVSHVDTATSLYVQQSKDTDTITQLLQNLFDLYESDDAPENIEPTVNILCCAKSEDDSWYRAKVIKIENDNVTVSYIDYGNSEVIPKTNIKKLDDRFYDINELALKVSLGLTETCSEFKERFMSITRDKELKAVIYYDNDWLIQIFDGDVNVNNVMIESGLVKEIVAETCLEAIKEDKRASIIVTHSDSPSEFYVQLLTNSGEIEKLQEELNVKIDELPNLEGVDIGSLCGAKYSANDQWYRAEVLDTGDEITTVRFVDFGNADVIYDTTGNIKQLPHELLSIDKYARKCSLNIKPLKDEWSPEVCKIFENAVNVNRLYSNIVYQDGKNNTYIELYDENGRNIGDTLIEMKHAEKITRDVEDDIANNTGFVSHINTISEFWIQLESSVPDLEMIAERLTKVETFPDLQDYSPGILCAALYPGDDAWYRGRILSNTPAGIEVLFIDYGNSSSALKLKVLPEDLAHMPALAQKCCLNKPNNVTEWTDNATVNFRKISEEGATTFTINKLAPGETHIVELFIDGNNIIELLQNRSNPIGEPETIEDVTIEENVPDSIKTKDEITDVNRTEEIITSDENNETTGETLTMHKVEMIENQMDDQEETISSDTKVESIIETIETVSNEESSPNEDEIKSSLNEDKMELSSKEDKIDLSLNEDKVEPSSEENKIDSSSKEDKNESTSAEVKMELSSKEENRLKPSSEQNKIDSSSKENGNESTSAEVKMETSSKEENRSEPSSEENKIDSSSKEDGNESISAEVKMESSSKEENRSEPSSKENKIDSSTNEDRNESTSADVKMESSSKEENRSEPSSEENKTDSSWKEDGNESTSADDKMESSSTEEKTNSSSSENKTESSSKEDQTDLSSNEDKTESSSNEDEIKSSTNEDKIVSSNEKSVTNENKVVSVPNNSESSTLKNLDNSQVKEDVTETSDLESNKNTEHPRATDEVNIINIFLHKLSAVRKQQGDQSNVNAIREQLRNFIKSLLRFIVKNKKSIGSTSKSKRLIDIDLNVKDHVLIVEKTVYYEQSDYSFDDYVDVISNIDIEEFSNFIFMLIIKDNVDDNMVFTREAEIEAAGVILKSNDNEQDENLTDSIEFFPETLSDVTSNDVFQIDNVHLTSDTTQLKFRINDYEINFNDETVQDKLQVKESIDNIDRFLKKNKIDKINYRNDQPGTEEIFDKIDYRTDQSGTEEIFDKIEEVEEEVLYVVDNDDFMKNLENAEHRLDEMKKILNQIETRHNITPGTVSGNNNGVNEAQTELTDTKISEAQLDNTLDENTIAPNDVLHTESFYSLDDKSVDETITDKILVDGSIFSEDKLISTINYGISEELNNYGVFLEEEIVISNGEIVYNREVIRNENSNQFTRIIIDKPNADNKTDVKHKVVCVDKTVDTKLGENNLNQIKRITENSQEAILESNELILQNTELIIEKNKKILKMLAYDDAEKIPCIEDVTKITRKVSNNDNEMIKNDNSQNASIIEKIASINEQTSIVNEDTILANYEIIVDSNENKVNIKISVNEDIASNKNIASDKNVAFNDEISSKQIPSDESIKPICQNNNEPIGLDEKKSTIIEETVSTNEMISINKQITSVDSIKNKDIATNNVNEPISVEITSIDEEIASIDEYFDINEPESIVVTLNDMEITSNREQVVSINEDVNLDIKKSNEIITNGKEIAPSCDVALIDGSVSINDDVAAIKEVVTAIKESIAAITENVTVINKDIAVINKDVAVITKNAAVITEDIAAINEDITVITDDVAVITEDIAVISEDVILINKDVQYEKTDEETCSDKEIESNRSNIEMLPLNSTATSNTLVNKSILRNNETSSETSLADSKFSHKSNKKRVRIAPDVIVKSSDDDENVNVSCSINVDQEIENEEPVDDVHEDLENRNYEIDEGIDLNSYEENIIFFDQFYDPRVNINEDRKMVDVRFDNRDKNNDNVDSYEDNVDENSEDEHANSNKGCENNKETVDKNDNEDVEVKNEDNEDKNEDVENKNENEDVEMKLYDRNDINDDKTNEDDKNVLFTNVETKLDDSNDNNDDNIDEGDKNVFFTNVEMKLDDGNDINDDKNVFFTDIKLNEEGVTASFSIENAQVDVYGRALSSIEIVSDLHTQTVSLMNDQKRALNQSEKQLMKILWNETKELTDETRGLCDETKDLCNGMKDLFVEMESCIKPEEFLEEFNISMKTPENSDGLNSLEKSDELKKSKKTPKKSDGLYKPIQFKTTPKKCHKLKKSKKSKIPPRKPHELKKLKTTPNESAELVEMKKSDKSCETKKSLNKMTLSHVRKLFHIKKNLFSQKHEESQTKQEDELLKNDDKCEIAWFNINRIPHKNDDDRIVPGCISRGCGETNTDDDFPKESLMLSELSKKLQNTMIEKYLYTVDQLNKIEMELVGLIEQQQCLDCSKLDYVFEMIIEINDPKLNDFVAEVLSNRLSEKDLDDPIEKINQNRYIIGDIKNYLIDRVVDDAKMDEIFRNIEESEHLEKKFDIEVTKPVCKNSSECSFYSALTTLDDDSDGFKTDAEVKVCSVSNDKKMIDKSVEVNMIGKMEAAGDVLWDIGN